MSEGRPLDAIVVGMGIAGLSCLWRLRSAGLDAIGLETSGRAGGVIRTRRAQGFVTEAGPNTVQGSPEVLSLAEELGLEGEILRADPKLARFVFRGGELLPVPTGVGDLLRTRLVSARAKLRLLGEVAVRRRRDPGEESVEAFVTRRFGREPFDAFVQPMVSGSVAGDGSRLSVDAVFPSLVEMEAAAGSVIRGLLRRTGPERFPIISFRDGFEVLTRRIAERLGPRIAYGSTVSGIRPVEAGGGFELEVRSGSRVDRRKARVVVVATEPEAAATVLDGVAPAAARALEELESPFLAVVSLAIPRAEARHSLRGFGFLSARDSGVPMLGCVWPSSIFPGRAPDGQALLTCFLGGATDASGASLDDASLVGALRRDLETVIEIRTPPRVLAIDRYPRAIPQYTLGHGSRVARIRQAVGAVPGLFLTGNYLAGISVGDVVKESALVAASIVERLRPRNAVDFPPSSV